MNLSRREWLQVLAAASCAGLDLARFAEAEEAVAEAGLYDAPAFGNVSFLHLTDCHAQLRPLHLREPSANLGVGAGVGRWPHLVGTRLLEEAGVVPGTPMAHAISHLDFERAARRFGRVGGFAALATLVKRLKAQRPGALLLDGGDTWQGSALSLWTRGQDMVDAAKLLGVDVMTGHWEFTYGMERVREIVDRDFAGRIDFVAQNVRTSDFGDPVFPPYVLREINGILCAVVGQAFPYTPIAHPRRFVADWTFGIEERQLQANVDACRGKGARIVVLLSHNGMDVDLKLASRVRGIDAIFGGHTHDAVPVAVAVGNGSGKTLVTNAGSNGKFLGVMDFRVGAAGVSGFRYRLLPVFADQLVPDAPMRALIERARAPHEARLAEQLAVSDGLLFRRGTFNGTWDRLLCDAMLEVQGAQIAFSPGFRWGTTLLPGETITREAMMEQLAITYPTTTLTEMSGEAIKAILEDVADNVFNPDPYYQQGGDMVRVGGLTYSCDPTQGIGHRLSNLHQGGKPLEPGRRYRVAGWAPVSDESATAPGPPIWNIVETWLAAHGGRVSPRSIDPPVLFGVDGNPGLAP